MAVFLVGSLGVAQLFAVTAKMQLDAKHTTRATLLASEKFDELMTLDFATDPALQIGTAGSLSVSRSNHYDIPVANSVIRRWQVLNGPTANTRIVTVRVIDGRGSTSQQTVDLTTVIRQW
jgi:hypothetical protein